MPLTMNREQVLYELFEIAARQTGLDRAGMSAETHFESDLNFDSLDVVEFTLSIEERFDIDIPDDMAERSRTVGQAADIVLQRLTPRDS